MHGTMHVLSPCQHEQLHLQGHLLPPTYISSAANKAGNKTNRAGTFCGACHVSQLHALPSCALSMLGAQHAHAVPPAYYYCAVVGGR